MARAKKVIIKNQFFHDINHVKEFLKSIHTELRPYFHNYLPEFKLFTCENKCPKLVSGGPENMLFAIISGLIVASPKVGMI